MLSCFNALLSLGLHICNSLLQVAPLYFSNSGTLNFGGITTSCTKHNLAASPNSQLLRQLFLAFPLRSLACFLSCQN